jgi:FixJ family two-component response regulator
MFTGSGRATIAVDAMKAGAQDYLPKDIIRIDTLVKAIDNAMERVSLLRERERQREELEASNARLRLLNAAVQAMGESVLITEAGMDSRDRGSFSSIPHSRR